ncbi:helix-turn-helix transcriptional regulator [Paenibacillus sp. IB182496]|uniref:Helix-turn-helix transcriptional regulator n=1 Tax=Paenibacillus sabuli TaxID=2772509 RepID=A0A927BWE1_9BACL|nr:helix-turn-helix transcriptional regulator [Paenibacillus sabuli]MBD2848082.1 helix-turn-helix transcriptional regulator [Paenibacillus sabuli]
MKGTGYKRLIRTFAPIFFFVVTVLFAVFFVAVYEMTRRDTEQATRIYAEHVMQTLDYDLQTVDQLVIRELLTNDTLARFFDPAHHDDYYLAHEVQVQLNEFVSMLPVLDSAYIYRSYDDRVVSNNLFMKTLSFGDAAFIAHHAGRGGDAMLPQGSGEPGGSGEGARAAPDESAAGAAGTGSFDMATSSERTGGDGAKSASASSGLGAVAATAPSAQWSEPRLFQGLPKDNPRTVISLVREFPLLGGSEGRFVVNVSTARLALAFSEMAQSELSELWLTDGSGQLVRSDMTGAMGPEWSASAPVTVRSELSGLEIRAGMKESGLFGVFNAISYTWLLLGIAGIAVSVVWMVLASRRQYRPVEAILHRIGRISQRKLLEWPGKDDDFGFIEHAIARLIENANELEQEATSGQVYRRKVLFTDIMEGRRVIGEEEWLMETERLGWRRADGSYRVAIAEIDKYKALQTRYPDKDQYLLKFAMVNVLEELTGRYGARQWNDWLSPSQLGVLIEAESGGEPELELMERLREWVDDNLHLTITVSVGEAVVGINEAVGSREQADQGLRYKSTLGTNRVIVPPDGSPKEEQPIYEQLQHIRELARLYRQGNEGWRAKYTELSAGIRQSLYERAEIINLVSYLQYQCSLEMRELSVDYGGLWNDETAPAIGELLAGFETFEELDARLGALLEDFYARMTALREEKDVYATVQQVKGYVAAHFYDSNLSLVQLGDRFDLTPTYLSRLFKEEIGEKLVDYIARLRMEHAMTLLAETRESVQDISARVGYVHAFSFIRAFKNLVGMTPGDYRKKQT